MFNITKVAHCLKNVMFLKIKKYLERDTLYIKNKYNLMLSNNINPVLYVWLHN